MIFGGIYVPRFKQIFFDLESKIIQKIYPSSSLLPSEHQLAKEYSVSRETIRKSLNMLRDRGYIHKVQGKGSFVLDVKRTELPIAGLTSYKEVTQSQNIDSTTIVHTNQLIEANEVVAENLEVHVGHPVHQLIRSRVMDNEHIILDIDYLNADFFDELPTKKMSQSLYDYIEKDLGYEISYALKEFTVEPVSTLDKKYMTIQKDAYVVVTRSKVYFSDTRLFQYTESHHRLDKFRFAEFARRKTI